MTTALYELRAVQMGLSLADMELLSMGAVFDMISESLNDTEEYARLATQADFDNF